MEYLREHKAYKYALDVVNDNIKHNEEIIPQAKYVKIQCKKFLEDLEDENSKYFFDINELEKITNLTKLINLGDGLKAGTSSYESLVGFQWFFIANIFCWKHKNKRDKRRYETLTLLIGRKSGKTFLVGLIFILLMLIEPRYSEFYSVAPDRDLSSKIKEEMGKIIDSSPYIKKRFKNINSETKCLLTESKFKALAYSENRMDARKANVFVADEVGGLRKRYPIDAMRSSQINMLNRTGILISTAYESEINPMVEEVEYAERVLDGLIEDEALFALLYKPDNPKDWTSDLALFQSNPLAFDLEDNLEFLIKQRKVAFDMPSTVGNYKTKHLNLFIAPSKGNSYISVDDIKQCSIESYDWNNKEVVLGLDLSMSGDNTAVSILTKEKGEYISQSWCFVPGDLVEEKSKVEKIDYRRFINDNHCFACGDRIIDYSFIEDFILSLEDKLGCKIKAVCYDKYNAISTVQKLSELGLDCVETPQSYFVLHPATKLLKESVLTNKFKFINNDLFVLNVSNAIEVTNPSGSLSIISKKSSKFKIDMLASLINCFTIIDDLPEPSVYDSGGITWI